MLNKFKSVRRKKPRTFVRGFLFSRRHPDLNWGSGCCRPMPYHLAISPYLILLRYYNNRFVIRQEIKTLTLINIICTYYLSDIPVIKYYSSYY